MIYLLIFAKLIKSGLLVKFVVLKMWSYFLSPTMVLEYIFILMIVGFYVVDAFTMYDTCRKRKVLM